MAKQNASFTHVEKQFNLCGGASAEMLHDYLVTNYAAHQYLFTMERVAFFGGWDVILADSDLCCLLMGAINWPNQTNVTETFSAIMG